MKTGSKLNPANKKNEKPGIQDTVALYSELKITDAIRFNKTSVHAMAANMEPVVK